MTHSNNKILVAMSGGADSTASAFLLKEKGYEVSGIHFLLYTQKVPNTIPEIEKALGITIHIVDARNIFEQKVIQPFMQQYIKGITPFPCALCNKVLKWPLLIEYADKFDFNYIATGHYAKIVSDGKYKLISPAEDNDKDQSFFLWSIKQEWMDRIVFPLAKRNKSEVFQILNNNGLSLITQNKESVSICFAGSNYQQFLNKRIDDETLKNLRGNFITPDGKIIGKHRGIHHYTIGQRRGLDVNIEGPVFITKIDAATKNITVGPWEELSTSSFYITDFYFSKTENIWTDDFEIKIRYRKQKAFGHLEPTENCKTIHVVLNEPEYAVAKGQSAVFIKGDLIIGGGFIA